VLPRVSKIANTLVPHDALLLAFVDASGELLVHATAGDLLHIQPQAAGLSLPESLIVGDLATEAMPGACEHSKRRVLAAGYRALMSVTARAREHGFSLQFWSKRPYAFDRDGLPMAHRIAHHIAVGVAHETMARAAAADPPIRSFVDRTGGTRPCWSRASQAPARKCWPASFTGRQRDSAGRSWH
jgi:hypothetical protein